MVTVLLMLCDREAMLYETRFSYLRAQLLLF